ncbi:MAG: hypothetical protein WC663_04080 [Patescibacteria group bacterium]|jgi:hypothetical protein
MLWIEADLVEIGLIKRLLNFGKEIEIFALANGDRNLAVESIRLWESLRKIVLPIRSGCTSVDLSFLFGIAKVSSLNVVSACKRWSLQKRGYELLGFRLQEDGLVIVENQDFTGFGSCNWRVFRIGDNGYSVCVHVKGTVSIWRFFVETENEKLILKKKLAFYSKDKRIFRGIDRLRQALVNKPGIDKEDIELLADSIYTCYRNIQVVLIDSDGLAADTSRNVAP